ncbi:capsule assembly Wzi family protein [Gallaecimonas sp. GXIMD4217]|uniref:capsule assembly Wzi family protein n=1 Tax=Gallaecimonas sp. GXIMD4217 TaxID=3131927 RepID=UPI00311B0DFA
MKYLPLAAAVAAVLLPGQGQARGVSPYLPLNLSPEIERQVERVLILADKPVLRRPIAAATVLDALPKACQQDPVTCGQVRRYLKRYMKKAGVSHASAELALTSDDKVALANAHGMAADSAYRLSASAYWQPSDYALVSVGGLAYEDESTPTNSLLSLGFEYAQLDVGYRDHWLSPMTDSALLISTQAQTMASVTLSNYTPITDWGFSYEFFLAEMSHSDRIRHRGGLTSGKPRLAGMHLSIEPVSGWSLGVNRVMQFGGGSRGGKSLGDIFDAFFRPSSADNTQAGGLTSDEEFGNQAASITSRFLFPGETPFAVYFEYGGEDTSKGADYRLGNAALSAGVHFPLLWQDFDLSYEFSEWQNAWYVHHIYLDGLTNEGNVIGHWGGDQRAAGDGVGGQSHMVRLGWQPEFGGLLEASYRTLANESYGTVDYDRAHLLSVSYALPWRRYLVGGELQLGRDVLGESYSRLSAFIRF